MRKKWKVDKMTQYKTVIVPTTYDDTNLSYAVAAEAITKAITEEAKDGWEVTLAQEMEPAGKGLISGLFGSKKIQKNTLLVFKKEEKQPVPEPPKEFDYDKFEKIVRKGVDYEKFANVMKKVVTETEVTISKKSFAGLKLALPAPAAAEAEEQQAALPLNEKAASRAARALPDKGSEEEEKSFAIARVLYEIFKENEGKEDVKGISFEDIMKASEGKLPENTSEKDVELLVNALLDHKKIKKEDDLYSLV